MLRGVPCELGCMLTTNEASCIQDCSRKSMATQARAVLIPLDSALLWPRLEQCVPAWAVRCWRNGQQLDGVQRRSVKMGLGA